MIRFTCTSCAQPRYIGEGEGQGKVKVQCRACGTWQWVAFDTAPAQNVHNGELSRKMMARHLI